jgi:hypothetical protein
MYAQEWYDRVKDKSIFIFLRNLYTDFIVVALVYIPPTPFSLTTLANIFGWLFSG